MPDPLLVVMMPDSLNLLSARRTVVRETLKRRTSCCSLGNLSERLYFPSRISALKVLKMLIVEQCIEDIPTDGSAVSMVNIIANGVMRSGFRAGNRLKLYIRLLGGT